MSLSITLSIQRYQIRFVRRDRSVSFTTGSSKDVHRCIKRKHGKSRSRAGTVLPLCEENMEKKRDPNSQEMSWSRMVGKTSTIHSLPQPPVSSARGLQLASPSGRYMIAAMIQWLRTTAPRKRAVLSGGSVARSTGGVDVAAAFLSPATRNIQSRTPHRVMWSAEPIGRVV